MKKRILVILTSAIVAMVLIVSIGAGAQEEKRDYFTVSARVVRICEVEVRGLGVFYQPCPHGECDSATDYRISFENGVVTIFF